MPTKRVSTSDKQDAVKKKKLEEKGSIKNFLAPTMPTINQLQQPPDVPTSLDSADSSVSSIFSSPNDDSKITSSTDTLVIEEAYTTDDFLNTQDILDDPELVRSLDAVPSLQRPATFAERLKSTFRPSDLWLDQEVSFEFQYEIQSLALALNERAVTVLSKVQKACKMNKKDEPGPKERHKVYKTIAKGKQIEHFTERSWLPSEGLQKGKENHRATYLSMTLSVDEDASEKSSPYKVKLNAPHTDKSCRLYRKYDNQRLMIMHLPLVDARDFPKMTSQPVTQEDIYKEVMTWLSEGTHKIAGHTWRVFFIDDKTRTRNDEVRDRQVHLFAIDDVNDGSNALQEMMNWHTPWERNVGSTDLKLFARYKLALSKTIPTIVFEQDEFIDVPDTQNEGGKIMDDGAGQMSFSAARAIANAAGIMDVPSIFQGRISGAKGVWIVVPSDTYNNNPHGRNYWITISPSQLKIKPHPRYRDADDETRTFEISAYSKPLRPAALNTQLITILHNRGVKRDTIASRLQDYSKDYYDQLCKAVTLDSAPGVRAWLQRYHSSTRNHEITLTGSVPAQKTDK